MAQLAASDELAKDVWSYIIYSQRIIDYEEGGGDFLIPKSTRTQSLRTSESCSICEGLTRNRVSASP